MSVQSFRIAKTVRLDEATIVVADHGPVRVLHVSGSIDATTARRWQVALSSFITNPPPASIGTVVDLTGTDLLSAAGMRALLASVAVAPDGIRLVIVARDMTLYLLKIIDPFHYLVVASDLGLALAMINDG